ncbi:hypothetical protein EZV62_023051 [Acer yangbiense]|uniref:Uncharacterized protein n=1 Tax=Acer yangbiense TaxID=1000413 RepID=A0A5C7H128_9ROSI|nr:hypothetical protein EZV62_023051 [Acer yangbiense]
MRGVNGNSRAMNNTFETINAAATAIASPENRAPQATVQILDDEMFCAHNIGLLLISSTLFCSCLHISKDGQAAGVYTGVLVCRNKESELGMPSLFLNQQPLKVIHLQLKIQAANHLLLFFPLLHLLPLPHLFAICPYAHETQLVSPPVFSTFTTEPSTAPFTPPPEPVHLTTPSSPEIPFAQLCDPSLRYSEGGQRFPFSQYEFQSYHLYPGSPVGHLISPSSGTSSPFPDGEFAAGGSQFPEFQMGDPPKLWNLDKLSTREWGSRQGSGTLTPDAVRSTPRNGFLLERQRSENALRPHSENGLQNNQIVNHRVSFELNAEAVVRCVEKKSTTLAKAVSESLQNEPTAETEESSTKVENVYEGRVGKTSKEPPEKPPLDVEEAAASLHQKNHSITLGSSREFNFNCTDGDSCEPSISSDWWANKKVVEKESGGTIKNWAFFPMMQPGMS